FSLQNASLFPYPICSYIYQGSQGDNPPCIGAFYPDNEKSGHFSTLAGIMKSNDQAASGSKITQSKVEPDRKFVI
ncbi:MAG: hypothetical protein IJL75_05430, partial [Eubacterium sp.]|nr:hypothetical protein [Eubacterium sp.]